MLKVHLSLPVHVRVPLLFIELRKISQTKMTIMNY